MCILAAVILASILPAQGIWATLVNVVTTATIVLLFFMHGAKLSRRAIIAGLLHWRLHAVVLGTTFIFFPLIGLLFTQLPDNLLPPPIAAGILYLCAMPSTVQSSIAFTSRAGGNISAAVCSAACSSLLGIFLSPIIIAFTMHVQGDAGVDVGGSISKIMLQLLLPFIAGHLCRPLIGRWMDAHKKWVKLTDNSSIVLIVYSAFSAAVLEGLWHRLSAGRIVEIIVICCILLALSLSFTRLLARLLHFSREDEITIVFCGSKKSLANGVPMANILFPAAAVGIMILPLMIFHQIQLIVCSIIADKYAKDKVAK